MELNRTGIIDRLKAGTKTIDDFNYDKLTAPPLSMLLNQYDIDSLYNIATSVRYSGNARKKYKAIDEILVKRDFSKLSAGTNRLCYKFLHDDRFVIKVAYDSVAIQDSPAEFINQFTLKPFCTKVFEVDPCGVVGSFERVDPITSREEFASVADDAYELIDNWLLSNGHIMADIGTKYFMNYGLRRGFGLVVIDFPYLYEIDGNKLFCISPDSNSDTGTCGGLIDFDKGFNELYCQKCGTMYRVKQIAKDIKEKKIIVKGGLKEMNVKIIVGGVDVSQKQDRIDGFKNEAKKVGPKVQRVPAPKSTRGNVASRVVNAPKPVITRQVRGNDDGYTKPKENNNTPNPTVKTTNNVEREKRPLPQRGETDQQQASEDSRGKTSVAAIMSDDYHTVHKQPVPDPQQIVMQNVSVTEAEAAYIASDNAVVSEAIASSEELIDDIKGQLQDEIKAKEYFQQEMNKYKQMAENATAELEQCKYDLNSVEEKHSSALEEIATVQDELKALNSKFAGVSDHLKKSMEINAANEETMASYRKSITEFEEAISEKDKYITDLQAQLAEASNVKVDPEKYVPIEVYDAKVEQLGLNIQEMQVTTKKMGEDIYDFCDFVLSIGDYILTPMEAEEDFEPEKLPGMSNLDGTICLLSNLVSLDEGQNDQYVIAFRCNDGSWLCSTEGKYIVVSSIGGVNLNDLVLDNVYDIISNELFDKYFSEDIDEATEATTEEVAENAENVDAGEN